MSWTYRTSVKSTRATYLPHAFWHESCFWFQHSAHLCLAKISTPFHHLSWKERAEQKLFSQLDRSTNLPAQAQTKNNTAVKNRFDLSLITQTLPQSHGYE